MRLEQATIGHIWQHAIDKGAGPPAQEYRLQIAEAVAGRVHAAVADDGAVLAIGGLFEAAPDTAPAVWLSVAPDVRRSLVAAVRLMLRCLRPGVVCYVRDDNAAGQRLARILKFTPCDRAIDGLRQWEISA